MSLVKGNDRGNDKSNEQSQPKLVIIGAGPGGYSATIRASQLGVQVTLIEQDQLGGTCLNWGCIPSKIMRSAADALENIAQATFFGVQTSKLDNNQTPAPASVDLAVLRSRQSTIINGQINGLTRHFKALGINVIKGAAKLEKPDCLAVTLPDGKVEKIPYTHLLLAIGSAPATIPGLEIDGERIISSNHALWLNKLPKSMLVVGGGVIGCELAQIFHSFGVKITLVEALPRLLPLPCLDAEITKTYSRSLKKTKITFYTGHTVAAVNESANGLTATLKPFSVEDAGENLPLELPLQLPLQLEIEQILVATGRKSIAASLDGLETLGVTLDQRGWIEAGPDFRTKAPNVWAIGDCLGPNRVMLAHVATAEGLAAVENMFAPNIQNSKNANTINYNQVPSAIFTKPEIACAGLSLAQAETAQPGSKATDFLFRQLGKAQAMNETDGLIRLICGPDETILGGQIIGPCATSLIGEVGLAVQQGMKAADLANTIHAHPTLPEGIWEAALCASGKPLHGN